MTFEKSWGQQAIKAAQRVNYEGAGTVEFIMDMEHNFYFMEMNTRLQVEHPVTEMVTNTDLVEWQFRVANGEQLPKEASSLVCNGHSIEARIYAEKPNANFQPSPGPLLHLTPPENRENLRIETGVQQGDVVTAFYDPMIAKLVVWGESREVALRKLFFALREYRISGLDTNVEFLSKIIQHPPFMEGELHTGYIDRYQDQLFAKNDTLDEKAFAQSVLAMILSECEILGENRAFSQDPQSPFSALHPHFQVSNRKLDLEFDSKTISCTVKYIENNKIEISSPDLSKPLICEGTLLKRCQNSFEYHTFIDNELEKITLLFTEDGNLKIYKLDSSHTLTSQDPDYLSKLHAHTFNRDKIKSPAYTSTLTKLYVTAGQNINKGDPILTLTAMKQEQTTFSSQDGVIDKVFFLENASVPPNSTIVTFQSEEEEKS